MGLPRSTYYYRSTASEHALSNERLLELIQNRSRAKYPATATGA